MRTHSSTALSSEEHTSKVERPACWRGRPHVVDSSDSDSVSDTSLVDDK